MAEPRLLQLRLSENMLSTKPLDGLEPALPAVEVLADGEVLGQLPITKAVYQATAMSIGQLTVTVLVSKAEVSGHE